MRQPVNLGEIQETLLIPLYGRALDARSSSSILNDRRAAEFVDAIDYDFTKFRGPSLIGSVFRASIFDQYVRDFLRIHPDGVVADLGCGLSTRFDRLDNGRVRWFDLDVADTIDLRRRFVDDGDRYTMIASSLFDTAWHDRVREPGTPVFLLSEAVLLYFPADEVTSVLRTWTDEFPGAALSFDTGGEAMMSTQDRNPVFRAVPARMKWTCDDPGELEAYGPVLRESRTFGAPQRTVGATWPATYRYGLRMLRWTPPVKTYKLNLFDIP